MPRRSESPPPVPPTKWWDAGTVLGVVWMLGFCVFFFRNGLPNNPPTTRMDIWPIVPFRLLDIVWPLPDANAPPSGLRFLPERLPAIGAALVMLGAAIGFGRLFLRSLRLTEQLTRGEELYFAGGVGLSLWSLITLGLGLIGGLLTSVIWALIAAGNLIHLYLWRKSTTAHNASSNPADATRLLIGVVLLICVPLVWAMLLGALSPQTDFDVLAYHLNGPKEWFQQGRITFLPHNIYTSFPFLTEMLLLSGMAALGDWSYGALAGQALMMCFAPLTALGLYVAGRRWFSETAGWLAALIWLTTPWTYRISIIAYAEGGFSFYLLASFLAACRAIQDDQRRPSWFLLTGSLAGSAMACKYPGLTSVIVPIGIGTAIVLACRVPLPELLRLAIAYAIGIAIAVGPWLAKNAVETGNPVYPLAYSLLDGRDLDPELNAKWERGHSSPKYASLSARMKDLGVKLTDIIANNDWHSPLLYAFAPLSWLWFRRRSEVAWAWAYIGWLFLTWFILTHHIDRFWVPMIPVVALMAGVGAASLQTVFGRWMTAAVIAACVAFNLTICSLIGGYNAGLTSMSHAEQVAERSMAPELKWLNDEYAADRLPADFKLLCEGDAATFHVRFPIAYHSVFDRCLLEEWCAAGSRPEFPLKSADEIRRTLQAHGITHVFVNWRWIANYREPGNYGFTDFLTPDRIQELQDLGVLGPPLSLPEAIRYTPLSDERRKQLETWAPSLIVRRPGEPAYLGGQIFPLR